MNRTARRLLLPAFAACLVALASALTLLPTPPAEAAASATKTCTSAGANVYTCTFTITPSAAAAPGNAWLVQMVPGVASFTSPASVVGGSTTGCGSGAGLPSVTAGTSSAAAGAADYNVTIGSAGCTATSAVVITETVSVGATGEVCQRVWLASDSPAMTACAAVVFTPSTAPTPSATKTCTPTPSNPNLYTCIFTVRPGVPAATNDVIHINEPPAPPMTGGAFASLPAVGLHPGCTHSPVLNGTSTSYSAIIMGIAGCAGTTWSIEFIETVAVNASGQICQSFAMGTASPTTACATVVFASNPPSAPTASATKSCTLTSPGVAACTFTITPGVAAAAGDPWPIQMYSFGTLTTAPTVVSATGCATAPAAQLLNVPMILATHLVTIGSGGCTANAVIVLSETVAVTGSGHICQSVWINLATPLGACSYVGATTTPTLAQGTLAARPAYSSGGIANVVFRGGSPDQLEVALRDVNAEGAWAQDRSGEWVLFVVAGGFVNEKFRTAFADGIPDPTALTISTRGRFAQATVRG